MSIGLRREWELKRKKAPRVYGWASPFIHPTSLFIRDYLLRHGEGYPQEIWRELKTARALAFSGKKKPIPVCSYDSFRRNYIYILKKLGLIEEVRVEVILDQPRWYKRRYYRIVPGKEALSDAWFNPQKVFRKSKYGYYRRKGEKK